MNRKLKVKNVIIVLVAVILIVVGGVFLVNKMNDKKPKKSVNYVTQGQNKINTSENVAKDKKVQNILLEKSEIIYENGTSKLTSKVTNNSEAKDNLRFKVKFIANDGTVIAESIGFVGQIKSKETKYIYSYITIDVSNANDIIYQIIE